MNTSIKHYLLLFLAILLTNSTVNCQNDGISTIIAEDYAPVTQTLADQTELIDQVLKDTTFVISPGVEETDIHYLSMKGLSMHLFILKVNLKQEGISLEPLTPNGRTSYAMQTIPDMLKWWDRPGQRVVAAVNADFYNMSTGEPRGVVHIDGEAIRTTPQPERSFLGVTEGGDVIIAHTNDYPSRQHHLKHALGGGDMLIIDHNPVTPHNEDVHPRTAVGLTDDKLLYFVIIDGRQPDYSNGMALSELTDVFKALDVKDAANLDGGGSTTFVTLSTPDEAFISNRPSGGKLRPIANGWAIVVSEKKQKK